ncbi:flagellar type III secretion system pore protein FliP [Novosphingobium beihaiensis]|uniref:Flagellar biosynthetic protein FliP n=1 Tax=Novosphingobium beihaiensis TaxID=2930389 RepID=A0ABT0BPN8_9SPHN|nr:flagellar type III secretion system pore protein FliP [Novosphingobium beihaiensis]MCJ2186981.1 flagellar type III secretion system pore protein FliP [Novosphingobium beihaiensis]
MRLPLARCGLLLLASPFLLAAAPVGSDAVNSLSLQGSDVMRTVLTLTLLAIVPALLITTTSFLRIVVVLSMIRHAFGMPQTPPNSVITSLALFLTAFVMGPTLGDLNKETVQPFLAGRMDISAVIDHGATPLKRFMLTHTPDSNIERVYGMARSQLPARVEDVDLFKLIPAFMLNELRVAFTIGFVVLLPFLLIDLVVASILLSLGMMMVPPNTISLPIKILMFVLIDGWGLIIEGLVGSFG